MDANVAESCPLTVAILRNISLIEDIAPKPIVKIEVRGEIIGRPMILKLGYARPVPAPVILRYNHSDDVIIAVPTRICHSSVDGVSQEIIGLAV